jgi:hypothetical protein
MKAQAVVNGKVVAFELSRGLSAAHRKNRGRSCTEGEAVAFVEAKRRELARKRAAAYLEDRR